MPDSNFNEYGFSITIDLIRKEGYSTDKLAHVVIEETRFFDSNADVLDTIDTLAHDAVKRASVAAGIRHNFEDAARALEAGDPVAETDTF